jgi:hypothetical protein
MLKASGGHMTATHCPNLMALASLHQDLAARRSPGLHERRNKKKEKKRKKKKKEKKASP